MADTKGMGRKNCPVCGQMKSGDVHVCPDSAVKKPTSPYAKGK